MDSVSRGELPDTLHLSFHSAEFDVFIQARQANYKSNADLTTGLTPTTVNCPKIKTGRKRHSERAIFSIAVQTARASRLMVPCGPFPGVHWNAPASASTSN